MNHGLYQVWVEPFRGRECTTFGFILVHFLYRKWNRKTDTQNGTMMYRNSPRLGTIIVPKRKEQAFPTFVYQYAPKIDPHLGGNRYMEWFTFERKRYGTLVYSCKHCLQKSANILTALLTALRLPLKRPPDVPAGALKQGELVTSAM